MLFSATPPGKNAAKISIFNFLAFVPVYKNSPMVLFLFCKFNFLLLLPRSYLIGLYSVDIYPNNRDFMTPQVLSIKSTGKGPLVFHLDTV